jgi:uncharacterized membrane protein YkoI
MENIIEEKKILEISKGEKARKDKEAKHAESERKRIEAEKIAKNNKKVDTRMANKPKRLAKKLAPKSDQDADFTSILQRQHHDQQPEPPPEKQKTSIIPYHTWEIRYRAPSKPGEQYDWSVLKGEEVVHSGKAASDKEAVSAAQNWIDMGAGDTSTFNSNANVAFNSKFGKMFCPGGQPAFVTFMSQHGKPYIIISHEPHEGLTRTTPTRRKGYNFPTISAHVSEVRPSALVPHGRYILDIKNKVPKLPPGTPAEPGKPEGVDEEGVEMYPLVRDSVVRDKNEWLQLPFPAFTLAYERDKD